MTELTEKLMIDTLHNIEEIVSQDNQTTPHPNPYARFNIYYNELIESGVEDGRAEEMACQRCEKESHNG